MTEPAEVADRADLVVDGVWTWAVSNSNIGGATSSCQALAADGEVVLIDPLRLADHAFDELPRPTAIVLTAKCHQRSAWRYRSQLGVEVWAPADAPEADEQPDRRYAEGDPLPGGLRAIRTPGPERAHYCLVREAAPHVLFCSDLLMAGEMAGSSSYRHGSTTTRPRRGEAWNACWTFRSTCSASTTALRSPPSPSAPCGRR